MTEAVRLDARRLSMLADMGVDVWILRAHAAGVVDEPEATPIVVPEPATSSAAKPAETVPEAVRSPEPAVAVTRRGKSPSPSPLAESPRIPDVAGGIEVACLTRPGALLLVLGGGWARAGRLGRDLLAAATGAWGSDPTRISFDWREPGDPSVGWRAFKAFADKQVADSDASVIFVNEALVEHLPERARSRTLVILPDVAELDTDAKRALWNRIRNLER